MSDQHKLSLRTAILINLNVMIGFGIFVNTVVLAQLAGFLGFFCYALVAALITPLVMSIAALMHQHPEGGFYIYGAKNIHPFAGFLSAWTYFVGKLASAALITHVVVTLFQALIPPLAGIPSLTISAAIILFFAFLNTLHMQVGSRVAIVFIVLKLTPILFAIISGLYLFSSADVPTTLTLWQGIPSSIPFVLYAFTGFEAACSLSKSIENAQVNGPRAIYVSFALAVLINILYQLLFFAVVGTDLMRQASYLGAFPLLLTTLLPAHPVLAYKIAGLLHIALACAALGGSYGILFSNHWNLYLLAQHGHVIGKRFFTMLNQHHIPVVGVLLEAIICIGYLVITHGAQAPLQQLSALGSTVAYTVSVIGLIRTQRQGFMFIHWAVPWLAMASCVLFIVSCIRNFVLFGVGSLLLFVGMIVTGIAMYLWTESQRTAADVDMPQ